MVLSLSDLGTNFFHGVVKNSTFRKSSQESRPAFLVHLAFLCLLFAVREKILVQCQNLCVDVSICYIRRCVKTLENGGDC